MGKIDLLIYSVFGLFVGLLIFFFVGSNFHLYFTDSPRMCVSCHVMQVKYESLLVTAHRDVECVDCHLPHDNFIRYWVCKVRDGIWDAYVYYTRREPEIIELKDKSRSVVEANCMRCHDRVMVHVNAVGVKMWCGTCHRNDAHPGPRSTGGILALKEKRIW